MLKLKNPIVETAKPYKTPYANSFLIVGNMNLPWMPSNV
jgi:hypothetical protein